ncbi:MAG: DNA-binding response regulator [Betaproteobacteria bacterium CG2_30_59_46]|nr:MAG: DNA-binding response regulator [Betaproteobacteria bacterium CG2_30_59_46]PIQ12016.1 MAG: DNA-binding response regulator [Hydrogenophilales bacterium CG18_big_fil_WC_8_21_14_2_50_58_12]PIX99081.1 MAG: DNA-binding response regulator [Hydrogenophilales bacterium CG_4_10_14_3_um_filter_58_23]PJB07688.1 MAG: DNA-binding response regulator [Hydrogenophilales bacterium CG_4_9_14_3_um_filter_59_35]
MKLLLVEDDLLLGDGLCAALGKAGFAVTWVRDGKTALGTLKAGGFAVMVLDIGLPVMGGMEVLCELRKTDDNLPVLMLTARDTTRDKVISLDRGADDYLVKTADMEELIARLRALIRRAGHGSGGTLNVGDLTLDLVVHTITRNGKTMTISCREFAVLRALMENAGRVLTRGQLEASLYGWSHDVDSNAIEVHIHNLRLKLGADCIKTLRGIGYTITRSTS